MSVGLVWLALNRVIKVVSLIKKRSSSSHRMNSRAYGDDFSKRTGSRSAVPRSMPDVSSSPCKKICSRVHVQLFEKSSLSVKETIVDVDLPTWANKTY